MDELLTKIIEGAPQLAGFIVLAYVLYTQNQKSAAQNERLLERIIELTREVRDCIQAAHALDENHR